MNFEYDEKVSRKVSKALEECCPAFVRKRDSEAGSEWHYCNCKAQDMDSCDCVWHLTDTCVAGKWSSLNFLNEAKKEVQNNSALFLDKATKAANSV